MSTVISQQCTALLAQSDQVATNDKLRTFFDVVTPELAKLSSPTLNLDAISQIVTALLSIDKKQFGKQAQLIDHPLLVLLRDCLVQLLPDRKQSDLASRLSVLFHNICFTGVSFSAILKLILSQPLVDELCRFFREAEKHVDEKVRMQSVNRLLEIFQNIQMVGFDERNNPLFELLFNSIAECILSPFFQHLLTNLPTTMLELTPLQTLLFDTAIEFMYWQPYEESHPRQQTLANICARLLHPTVERMSAVSLSEPLARLGSLLALNVAVMDVKNVDKEYYALLDRCVTMLDQRGNVHIQRTVLATCCFLSYEINLTVHMKQHPRLKSICLELSESDDAEISFHAYRILAMIMTEEDIKTLSNASKIVGVFSIYFISMSGDPMQRTAFHSLLHSLKSFVQHDQIKAELLDQGVVPLLIECVTEPSFHTVQVRQYALEILLALSFNDRGLSVIASDATLTGSLKKMSDSSEEGMRRVASHLLWQFEHKAQHPPIHPLEGASHKFDIMLSYSHSDKALCFQIHDQLVSNGFRVWLDRERMRGDTMSAMADAIENSAFVIICMSDAYKQSPYCQAEAQYAFQRQRKLIPLVMRAKYKPDGWLGFIMSGKIYVDFTKHEFNTAFTMLRSEIEHKRSPTNIPEKVRDVTHDLPPPKLPTPIADRREFPPCVDSWSADHVRSFLTVNNFTSLLPVFADFNGRLLHDAYSMCQSNRESMFQSMKSEIGAAGNGPMLTLGTYLRFLEELKKYIPVNLSGSTQIHTSAACNMM